MRSFYARVKGQRKPPPPCVSIGIPCPTIQQRFRFIANRVKHRSHLPPSSPYMAHPSHSYLPTQCIILDEAGLLAKSHLI